MCFVVDGRRDVRNFRSRMRKSLTKQERLCGRRTISACFRRGRPFSCRGSKLLVSSNDLQWNRILLVPTRKYGTAVDRNRVKRLGREAFRHQKAHMKTGYDIIWIFYPGGDTLSERSGQLRTLCRRADLLEQEPPAA